jgi:RNA polymerase sigma-70 factor (ECF subfamily)
MERRHAETESEQASAKAAVFSTTHWSVVVQAGQADSTEAAWALERLCRTYWYPLYVFVRRKGYSPEDAQDLTQDFFTRFLEKKYVGLADQSRGKFRTFMLQSLEHFLINEWAKAHAAKRGGHQQVVSWDEAELEKRYLAESVNGEAPDKIFEKRWATNLLDQVMNQLRTEFSPAGKEELFEALKTSLWGEPTGFSYQEIGAKLAMTEGAVKVAAYRLRQQYRELLRAEVACTVGSPDQVDEELRYLAAVLRS